MPSTLLWRRRGDIPVLDTYPVDEVSLLSVHVPAADVGGMRGTVLGLVM